MAKNAQKTNALGMELDPSTFEKKESGRPDIQMPYKPGKSPTRSVSFTLQEEAIEKLNKLAEEQDISKSKVINRWLMSL